MQPGVQGQPAHLFRNKSVNTVLVVPTKARKYRKALYLFDFLLTWLGMTAACLSIYMMKNSSGTLLPSWIFTALLVVSLIVLVIGGLGGRGAVVAFRRIEDGEINWWLVGLTMLVGTLLTLELATGIWIITEYTSLTTNSLHSKQDSLSLLFQNSLKSQLDKENEFWWDWQANFDCCGYDNNTIPSPLATGKYCTTNNATSAPECKAVLWAKLGNEAEPLAIFFVVFLLFQFIVCMSALCLGCVIKAQEPIYRDY